MAKRQNFVVGSGNPVTVTKTPEELNTAWNQLEVLKAGDLNGVIKATSYYSNDSSNEIANAIQSLTGSAPTGSSQEELGNAIQSALDEIKTTSLTFKGYVATSAPSSSTFSLKVGNIWINKSTMPTSFPVAASSIKVWNGNAWATTTDTYTAADFDFFRNINDNEGYYWFGGVWKIMSTDMSTTYFSLDSSGKWQINPTYDATLVHSSGGKTETITGVKTFTSNVTIRKDEPKLNTYNSLITRGQAVDTTRYTCFDMRDKDDKQLGYVRHAYFTSNNKNFSNIEIIAMDPTGNNSNTTLTVYNDGTPENRRATLSINPASASNDTTIATTKWVKDRLAGYEPLGGGAPTGTVTAFAGSTAPTGWLICNGGAISRTTYSKLFGVIGTTYGSGDGSTTFNLPNWTGVVTGVTIPNTIPVYGNGMTLGLTNGEIYTGLTTVYLDNALRNRSNAYGVPYNTPDNTTSAAIDGRTIGLTTEPNKSGIVAKSNSITKSTLNSNMKFIIRY